eukprot:COSAG02_NODE_32370_length_517_cov_1.122010_2_plen_80_part_00
MSCLRGENNRRFAAVVRHRRLRLNLPAIPGAHSHILPWRRTQDFEQETLSKVKTPTTLFRDRRQLLPALRTDERAVETS